jgi:regulator of replication initiation timing
LKNSRDDLFDSYLQSQSLAVRSARDNIHRAQTKALQNLKDHTNAQKRQEVDSMMHKNMQVIQALKARVAVLEGENQLLVVDNETLRQQSLDGFQIGKEAVHLSDDRQKLSVDLADKAEQIRMLLLQHDGLQRQWQETQRKIQLLK